jgi:hypothetical protein
VRFRDAFRRCTQTALRRRFALQKCFARNLFALSLLTVAASAQAEWKILSVESEPGRAGIEHRHAVMENTPSGQRADFDVAIFSNRSCASRLIDNPDGQTLAVRMKGGDCLCGVNGGYFDPEFKPIGLRIADARVLSPLRRAHLVTGILLQSGHSIEIVRVSQFSRTDIVAAIQAGPFLVDRSKPVRGLNDSQRARRTFAGTGGDDRALLGVCSDVSLAELANILATVPIGGDFKIRRAMNLDGGSSSAFWFARENGSAFSIPGQKPVRDFVAVVPR